MSKNHQKLKTQNQKRVMLKVEYRSLIETSEEYRQINTPAKNIAEFKLYVAAFIL